MFQIVAVEFLSFTNADGATFLALDYDISRTSYLIFRAIGSWAPSRITSSTKSMLLVYDSGAVEPYADIIMSYKSWKREYTECTVCVIP